MRRILRYNISESFNVVRWCLTVIAFAFVAVVSVAKFVQLADLTSLTFSSLEITYLVLSDTTNIVYIYLPLYLFLICGMMFDDNFGTLEVIKCGTRFKWVLSKFMTLLFYTFAYFIVLFVLNFLISYQVFPYSEVWSSDFLKVQVMMGEQVQSFTYSPMTTIGLALLSTFLLYFCVGSMSVFFSLVTNREAYALFASLLCGLGISALFVFVLEGTKGVSVAAFTTQNILLFIGSAIMLTLSAIWTNLRDFNIQKRQ